MYFIVRNHKLYSWAMQLSGVSRFLVTSAVVATLWIFWSYGVYTKNNYMIYQYRCSIATLQAQKEQTAHIIQEYTADQKIIDELHDFINPYYALSSEKSLAQARMIEIINFIKKSNLHLIRCNAGKDIDKDWYIKHIIRVDAVGTLAAIQQFFLSVKKAEKMIQCSQASIDRKDEELFHLTTDMHVISLKDKKIPST